MQQKAHACTGTKVMMSVLRTWQHLTVMEDTGSGLAISARQQKFDLSACSQPSSPSMFFSDWYPGSMDFTRASASPMDMNSCFVMSTVIESFGRNGQVAGLEKEEMKF